MSITPRDRTRRPNLIKGMLAAGTLTLLSACGQSSLTSSSAPNGSSASAARDPSPIVALADISPAADPDSVSFTLEGCRNNGTITLPNSGGKFICPDGAYTTGNLGKGWNELDLVPYRVTAKAGNSAPSSQTYTVSIVVDNEDAGKPGYDVLSVPVLNTALSSPSGCSVATVDDPAKILTPGLGGIDKSLYRRMNVTQARNTTCVYDYYARLALGSHLFPGSSLHANLANKVLGTAGIGSKDVSIPVKEILPQELRKDMSATQGTDSVWNVTKAATPASVLFPDTCDVNAPRSKPVSIRVTWTKGAPTPSGQVTVTTNIYAKNPASRLITVNVSDVIRSGTSVLDTISTAMGGVDVAANTELLVLTHSFLVPAGTADLNDIATASYTDKVTGVAVPGTTTATASATVQSNGTSTNQTASVSDVESLVGAGFTFSTDSFAFTPTGPSGSFSSYTAGTATSGPVTWTSGTLSAGGYVDFSKTVYVAAGGVSSTGTLSDTATLTTSGSVTANASASVNISSDARVKLTIDKTIPNVLSGNETQTFTFRVYDASNVEVATPTISFAAGETSKSVTVSNLAPGTYTVKEDAATGWAAQSDQTAAIALPSCSGSVSFANVVPPASAKVRKVTLPAGSEAGWEMTLTGPGTPAGGEKVTTTGTGSVTFTTALQEGSYTITETSKTGFDQTSASTECSFTVNYPADAARVFDCVFTNTKRGTIIVEKQTNPDGASGTFAFTGTAAGSIGDGQTIVVSNLAPGTYTSTEAVPAGWDLSSIVCDDNASATASSGSVSTKTATFKLDAGETVKCVFTNLKLPKLTVVKVVNNDFGGTKGVSDFTLKVNSTNVTSGVTNTYPVGNYTVSEATPLPYGYTQDSIVCVNNLTNATTNGGAVNLAAGDDKTCTITNSDSPATIVIVKYATPANGSFAFTTTGSGYTAGFTLTGATTGDTNKNVTTNLGAGTYKATENTQLGWYLTAIGGSNDPTTPDACMVSGQGGSTGQGDLNTQTATINLKMGDTVTCVFENTGQGVTRTQGFWSTHPNLALIAWTGGALGKNSFPGVTSISGIGDMALCGKPVVAGSLTVTGSSDLMGGFWSGISKTSQNKSRSALDQSRMQLLQQLLAAELNASAFGSVPSGGMGKFAAWEAAYCGTNATAMQKAQQEAANFNQNGDSGTFTPGTAANSKLARAIANYVRWDSLP
ncbi:MSCRAMM family protein [Deinococcus yavapaiensis]|uniref:Ig-like domain-containing protein n=1 Tax=Deinococcus yavapaiensis KR-236 TaxID=694435 RepID=A0A318S875_9DEIO|nr:hypothetical protein [Deinococcus yavapaiensis]PYE54735.1 hypothetical protein DES52_1045 [Deinococcus yavapaiensis KR-236]